jgi:hypothetical protein
VTTPAPAPGRGASPTAPAAEHGERAAGAGHAATGHEHGPAASASAGGGTAVLVAPAASSSETIAPLSLDEGPVLATQPIESVPAAVAVSAAAVATAPPPAAPAKETSGSVSAITDPRRFAAEADDRQRARNTARFLILQTLASHKKLAQEALRRGTFADAMREYLAQARTEYAKYVSPELLAEADLFGEELEARLTALRKEMGIS